MSRIWMYHDQAQRQKNNKLKKHLLYKTSIRNMLIAWHLMMPRQRLKSQLKWPKVMLTTQIALHGTVSNPNQLLSNQKHHGMSHKTCCQNLDSFHHGMLQLIKTVWLWTISQRWECKPLEKVMARTVNSTNGLQSAGKLTSMEKTHKKFTTQEERPLVKAQNNSE